MLQTRGEGIGIRAGLGRHFDLDARSLRRYARSNVEEAWRGKRASGSSIEAFPARCSKLEKL
jgi:hypothetical protein